MMDAEHIWGLLAVVFALAAPIPYIITIRRGQTKPHPFSWIIWTLLNAIAFSAQIAAGAGPGAWVTVASGLVALMLAIIAIRARHGIDINRKDWVSFGIALSGIPLWLITDEPLMASIVVTVVNTMAYFPTMRKAWHHPDTENGFSFFLHWCKVACGLLAMSSFNLTTVLYPAAIFASNLILMAIIYGRRAFLRAQASGR